SKAVCGAPAMLAASGPLPTWKTCVFSTTSPSLPWAVTSTRYEPGKAGWKVNDEAVADDTPGPEAADGAARPLTAQADGQGTPAGGLTVAACTVASLPAVKVFSGVRLSCVGLGLMRRAR